MKEIEKEGKLLEERLDEIKTPFAEIASPVPNYVSPANK